MTVNIETTSKKYRGSMARNYDTKRKKQQRWDAENAAVESMVEDLKRGTTLLDAPMGTGRFLSLWKQKGFKFSGVDSSDEMIELAVKKGWPRGSASVLRLDEPSKLSADVVVCVRFFDLIDEKGLYAVLDNLNKIAKRRIVCTIRFGVKYEPKSNTAEHDEKKFTGWLKRRGWQVTRRVPVFNAGWHVLQLDRY